MQIKIKKLHADAVIPTRATKGSAGFDLTAIEDVIIQPFSTALVSTGISLELPVGWEAQVRPRSGMSLKTSLIVANAPGTIDSDYRGEIQVILKNVSANMARINQDTRIAQLVFQKVPAVELVEVTELNETERGAGGFGSTD